MTTWDDGTNVTEYCDIDDHNAVDNDGYYDEYDEFEDYDGELIDMSGIPEDRTFEEPELACMLENLQKGKKGSSKGHRKSKKGWGKGESRDKEGGKGGRPENYKQVRLKLQSDRLNRGWRDQPARGTNKGRGRPQLAQVDDLLARARCFKCGELGHFAKDWPQNKGDGASLFSGVKDLVASSETFFIGMVCDEPNAERDLRNEPCAEDDFRKDDETFPVPFSSSSSSLGCVAGPHEIQHQDLKQESNDETEHITSEPLVDSPDAKRQMEIDIANGASVCIAYKAMRKRLRIEARRQGSVVVVGPRENVCSDMKFESDGEHRRQQA